MLDSGPLLVGQREGRLDDFVRETEVSRNLSWRTAPLRQVPKQAPKAPVQEQASIVSKESLPVRLLPLERAAHSLPFRTNLPEVLLEVVLLGAGATVARPPTAYTACPEQPAKERVDGFKLGPIIWDGPVPEIGRSLPLARGRAFQSFDLRNGVARGSLCHVKSIG
jgi:hypothetical protein